jgi:hypothetical protein
MLDLLGRRNVTLSEPAPSDDDWYLNLVWIERQKCLLLTHSGKEPHVYGSLGSTACEAQALSQVTLGFQAKSNPLGLGAQIQECSVHTLTAGSPYGARLVQANSWPNSVGAGLGGPGAATTYSRATSFERPLA